MLERFKKSRPAQQPEPATMPAPAVPSLTGVPQGLNDSAVYDGITCGFDTWLTEARS